MTSHLRATAVALTLLVGACDRAPTAPAASHGLSLSVRVLPSVLPVVPSYPVFTVELLNTSDQDVTVVFGTTCAWRSYITDLRGRIVYPDNGGRTACGDAITSITVAPGRGVYESIELRSGPSRVYTVGSVTLPPGVYRAHAEVEGALGLGAQRVSLRARPTTFRLPYVIVR